uniref:Uncharacterized protein n=1 Tax=Rhizophora mucronata TaxID=61149 RepID=A0A2P2Q236_RHIMU
MSLIWLSIGNQSSINSIFLWIFVYSFIFTSHGR